MNQNGFIVIPALIWWVLGAVVLTSVAVKEGAISIEYPPKTQEEVAINVSSPTPLPTYKPTPTPSSTPISKPTQKPVVQQGVQANQNTQQPTHDGSRTGPIVDYYELCTGKTIKIYENERIPYKTITGETVYSTKGDIKCYEDQIKQLVIDTARVQSTSYQPSSTYIRPPTLPPYEPLKFNIPPPPKIEPFVPKNISPTFPTPAPLKIEVEPEPCIVVPPGFGGATSGRVNEDGFPCAN